MPEKTGGGGHISEAYDESTGQYVESPSSGGLKDTLKDTLLAFAKAKKEAKGTAVPVSLWDYNNLVQNSVVIFPGKPAMNTKNLKYAFDNGTPEAQRLFCDFFNNSKTKIARHDSKTCFSPKFNILFKNTL